MYSVCVMSVCNVHVQNVHVHVWCTTAHIVHTLDIMPTHDKSFFSLHPPQTLTRPRRTPPARGKLRSPQEATPTKPRAVGVAYRPRCPITTRLPPTITPPPLARQLLRSDRAIVALSEEEEGREEEEEEEEGRVSRASISL